MTAASMQGNPHAVAANASSEGDGANAYALVEATLALAFEQRTANLIAFARLESVLTDATEHFGDEEIRQIAERLGLQ